MPLSFCPCGPNKKPAVRLVDYTMNLMASRLRIERRSKEPESFVFPLN
nr:MAG TPA: hypothetical protein [Caudoviricetes sp.]